MESARVRAFKGEEIMVPLRVKTGSVSARMDLVTVPDGLEAEIKGEGKERSLVARSRYAGVYTGLKARVEIADPLEILARSEVKEVGIVCEFLPTSLLGTGEPIRVSATRLGDLPAGRGGSGQEFYAAEVYTTSRSAKDIMWKRHARTPDELLLVRTGEANIPERMNLWFYEEEEGEEKKRTPARMDLASEAIARVGLPVVSTGTKLRVRHIHRGRATLTEAKDREGLADLVAKLWEDEAAAGVAAESPSQADMVITSEEAAHSPEVMGLVMNRPSVLLVWGEGRGMKGSSVVFFSGHEDLSSLVGMVLSK
ncbi:MAG: hypothetical protein JRN21_02750 [Nitrososphaerota archaeon]|nr:hypothetical protein [Nitrososphaerota archaeon]